MDNLKAIRQISQNRSAYFKYKKEQNKEYNPVIKSSYTGPLISRKDIMETINYIEQKYDFVNMVDNITQTEIPHHSTFDMVIVTCLYFRPNLWRMVLSEMAKYPVKKIIAVWSEKEDEEEIIRFQQEMTQDIVKKIKFIYHPNLPLNEKWQFGVMQARHFSPEAVMILGSDDLVTYQYCRAAMKKIREGYELVGSREWMSIFVQDEVSWESGKVDWIRYCRYNEMRLDNEFIGTGRVISSYILERMKWQLYTAKKPLNSSLDKHSYYNLKQYVPKMYQLPLNSDVGLGIVTFRERSSEEHSITFGKWYDPRRVGSTWTGVMVNKSRYIDYEVSKRVYEKGVGIIYKNFIEGIRELRCKI